jgi:hypothetical protein
LYILDGDRPVPITDTQAWAEWMATHDRQLGSIAIGPFEVRTIFLGMDLGNPARRRLFETFVQLDDEYASMHLMGACGDWQEAVAMHARAVRQVQERWAAVAVRLPELSLAGLSRDRPTAAS